MPNESRGNLLHQPLISVRIGSRIDQLALPAVLEYLGSRDELEFDALRPHQQHAWYAFLVQIAALVMYRTGISDPTQTTSRWRDGLLQLAGDAGSDCWQLVVDDLNKPAFMQTPVPEESLDVARYKREPLWTPDQLDILITAKNHDVKQARMIAARPEHWLYALVVLQTMQGFLGAGNYGIARMNGGFGSRPAFATAPELRWPERFRRDVAVWLSIRDQLVKDHGYKKDHGMALLWLQPWDGTESRTLADCDPFFLEVCRRVRLSFQNGVISARAAPTKAPFLRPASSPGDTGDIWTPVAADGKALTVGPDGLSYRLMTRVLFRGDFPSQPALRLRESDGIQPVVVAQVLVRGQGKTDHYRERVLPIPPKIRSKLLSDDSVDATRSIAKQRVERVTVATRKVLQPALCILLQGGPDKADFRDVRTQPWIRRFDQAVDEVFFGDLWEALDLSPQQGQVQWDRRLVALARHQLDDAIAAAPISEATRPRAVARAELVFSGSALHNLPAAYRPNEPAEVKQ